MSVPVGNLFVIAAPSGGGKTSLTRALLEREPGIRLSVSYTTRPPRPGEGDGVDYHFVSADRFAALKDGNEFLEHAQVHGNWYATSATWLKSQVRALIPESVHIFILPPSLGSLEERLVRRGQDDRATIARRLIAAREEIRHCVDFNYVIINQEFATAVDDLTAVVRATRLRTAQQLVRHQPLITQLSAQLSAQPK